MRLIITFGTSTVELGKSFKWLISLLNFCTTWSGLSWRQSGFVTRVRACVRDPVRVRACVVYRATRQPADSRTRRPTRPQQFNVQRAPRGSAKKLTQALTSRPPPPTPPSIQDGGCSIRVVSATAAEPRCRASRADCYTTQNRGYTLLL